MNTLTPIGWPLRAWFAAELFFAVAATLSVGLQPQHTASNFAWSIQPPVMAALIGAFYIALAPVVVLLLLARHWEQVRVFVLPAAVFTLIELLVTLLHWDRFAVWTGPFNIWFASYLLPPPVFVACYAWQQRRAQPPARGTGAQALSTWQRRLLLALGALFTAEAVIALAWPSWFTASAPWKVTPLNARALAGYLALLGLLLLSMAREDHRRRVAIVAPFLVLLLPAVAWQLGRFADQVDWRHPRVAVLGVLLLVLAGLGASLLHGAWRHVRAERQPQGNGGWRGLGRS